MSESQKPAPDQLSLDAALRRLTRQHEARRSTPFELARGVSNSLDNLCLSWEERIQVIGGAFVLEALREVWNEGGGSADAAHALLRSRDPELADAVEALAPMLYGRHTATQQALAALDEVARILQSR